MLLDSMSRLGILLLLQCVLNAFPCIELDKFNRIFTSRLTEVVSGELRGLNFHVYQGGAASLNTRFISIYPQVKIYVHTHCIYDNELRRRVPPKLEFSFELQSVSTGNESAALQMILCRSDDRRIDSTKVWVVAGSPS